MKVNAALVIIVIICTYDALALCPRIQTIENGWVEGNGYLGGDTLSFRCKKDYVLEGERRVICTRKGRWSHGTPTCKASCSPLPLLSDGYTYGASRKHGSYVLFGCAYGHQLVGSSRLKCNNGNWWGRMPRCLAICIPIKSIRNGWVDGGGNLKGDTLSFRCKADYVLEGEHKITCIGHLQWNHKKPTCKAPCTRINSLAHGGITQQGFRHNEDINFECDRDYYLQGRNVLTCSDGLWNATLPTCLAPCKQFDARPFAGGYIKRDGYKHNEEVTFGCREPYVIDGQETLRCDDGAWSNRLPSCGGPCRRFASPANGEIVKDGFKHKETVKFRCKPGFQLVGSSDRLCNFGVWNDSAVPRCKVNCGDPGHPTNGLTTAIGGFTYENIITFSCNDNYVLKGSFNATCQIDGKWSKNLPMCLEKCSDPSGRSNAYVNDNTFYHGKEVEFSCLKDYTLVPSSSKKLTCQDGDWKGTIPSCKAPCPPLPRLSDGYKYGTLRTHGAYVRFYCAYGHQLVGSPRLTCNDGTWSDQVPRCLAVCRRILKIANAWIDGNGYLEGDKLSFRCRTDYVLDGERSITCTGNRRWSHTTPTCKAPCERILRVPAYGRITQQGFRHNEDVKFECDRDYYLLGEDILTCSDGKWNGVTPFCLSPCPHMPEIQNGNITGDKSRTHGSVRFFSCDPGYHLVGLIISRCFAGRWTQKQPQCLQKCSDPSGKTNATVIGNQFYHGKEVEFVCPRDSVLHPSSSRKITCQGSDWRGTIPSCIGKPKFCQEIQMEYKRKVKGSGVSPGSERTFSCVKNWKLSGAKVITCLENGQWSAPSPTCKLRGVAIDCPVVHKIEGGFAIRNESFHGGRVVFQCNPDYIMIGKRGRLCKSGKWNRPAPKCLAPCVKLRAPKNGFIQTSSGNRHGGVIVSKCNQGYTMLGSGTMVCSNGSWNDVLPVCQKTS